MTVVADLELCQGHGMCEDTAPDVFRVVESDDGSYPHVEIVVSNPDAGLMARVQSAVNYCPNRALSIR